MGAALLAGPLGVEELIALGDLPDILPKKKGKAVSMHTFYRWTLTGLAGVEPLESVLVGGTIYTSREALDRFLNRINRTKGRKRSPVEPPAVPSRASIRASEELAALGM